jgi:hypothetical protein
MTCRHVIVLWISGMIAIGCGFAAEIDEATLKALNDDSFQVREEATKKLVQADVSIDEIQRLAAEAEEPEVKHRLNLVVQGKMERIGWVDVKNQEAVKRAVVCGKEADGKDLYLARTRHDDGDVIGKYMPEWGGGNFPTGETESLIPECQIWIGKGVWKKWNKDSQKPIPMGKTKEGKLIYAVRANFNGGIHPGTLIQGETEARISWGGNVNLLKEFEILETE